VYKNNNTDGCAEATCSKNEYEGARTVWLKLASQHCHFVHMVTIALAKILVVVSFHLVPQVNIVIQSLLQSGILFNTVNNNWAGLLLCIAYFVLSSLDSNLCARINAVLNDLLANSRDIELDHNHSFRYSIKSLVHGPFYLQLVVLNILESVTSVYILYTCSCNQGM
jgi:hypothetical protein